MERLTYVIKFDNVSMAEGNRYASELRDALLDATSDIRVDQKRDNPHAQDFGASLVLVFGTPAALAIVKAIGNWLQIRNSASLVLEKDGRIIAKNITSKDAAKLTELFLTQK